MDEPLRVGALARKAGVNVETIRYYQRLGLIDTPERPLGGQRGYPPATVERLKFIRRAQQLGFTLEEIADLLKLQSGVDRASVRRIAGARLEQIRERVADLTRMEHTLHHLLEHCAHAPGRHRCPIIEAITGPTTGASASPSHASPQRASRSRA
jgi:MerR family mercuric resistance operon transcriptional regulator